MITTDPCPLQGMSKICPDPALPVWVKQSLLLGRASGDKVALGVSELMNTWNPFNLLATKSIQRHG